MKVTQLFSNGSFEFLPAILKELCECHLLSAEYIVKGDAETAFENYKNMTLNLIKEVKEDMFILSIIKRTAQNMYKIALMVKL